jgi:hypothetical protein
LYNIEDDPFEARNLVESSADADTKALEHCRDIIENTIDFEQIKRDRDSDEELQHTYRLGVAKGTPNQYHFPDDRVIDADTIIYHPRVIAEDPSAIYDDFPTRDTEN